MAKVSIIVPTYNVEQYLEECLESLRRQTLHELRLYVLTTVRLTDRLKYWTGMPGRIPVLL